MAMKMLLAFIAVAMLVQSVSATYMLDAFIEYSNDGGWTALIKLMVKQTWAFLAPFLGGPLRSWSHYLYYVADGVSYDANGTTFTLKYNEVLGVAGIGSYEQFYAFLMTLLPRIIINIVPGVTKETYSTLQTTVAEKLELTLP